MTTQTDKPTYIKTKPGAIKPEMLTLAKTWHDEGISLPEILKRISTKENPIKIGAFKTAYFDVYPGDYKPNTPKGANEGKVAEAVKAAWSNGDKSFDSSLIEAKTGISRGNACTYLIALDQATLLGDIRYTWAKGGRYGTLTFTFDAAKKAEPELPKLGNKTLKSFDRLDTRADSLPDVGVTNVKILQQLVDNGHELKEANAIARKQLAATEAGTEAMLRCAIATEASNELFRALANQKAAPVHTRAHIVSEETVTARTDSTAVPAAA